MSSKCYKCGQDYDFRIKCVWAKLECKGCKKRCHPTCAGVPENLCKFFSCDDVDRVKWQCDECTLILALNKQPEHDENGPLLFSQRIQMLSENLLAIKSTSNEENNDSAGEKSTSDVENTDKIVKVLGEKIDQLNENLKEKMVLLEELNKNVIKISEKLDTIQTTMECAVNTDRNYVLSTNLDDKDKFSSV